MGMLTFRVCIPVHQASKNVGENDVENQNCSARSGRIKLPQNASNSPEKTSTQVFGAEERSVRNMNENSEFGKYVCVECSHEADAACPNCGARLCSAHAALHYCLCFPTYSTMSDIQVIDGQRISSLPLLPSCFESAWEP